MGEPGGHTVLIVVDNENALFARNLQTLIGRAGAQTMVASNADALMASNFAAAVVSVEQQALVAKMNVPVVVYYADDTAEQVVARLRRLGVVARHDEVGGVGAKQSAWRGRMILVLVLFLAAIAAGVGMRWVLKAGFGWS